MVHTKFQGHRLFGSGVDFFTVFVVYGHDGHLGHVTETPWTNTPEGDSLRNMASLDSVASREMFENLDGRQNLIGVEQRSKNDLNL